MKSKTKSAASRKQIGTGDVVVCINDTPRNKKFRKIALKTGQLYIALVVIKEGRRIKSIIVGNVSGGQLVHKYPYCWDAKRFMRTDSTNYMECNDENKSAMLDKISTMNAEGGIATPAFRIKA